MIKASESISISNHIAILRYACDWLF